jgi:hypothetical protein
MKRHGFAGFAGMYGVLEFRPYINTLTDRYVKQGSFNSISLGILQQSTAEGVTAITQDTYLKPDVVVKRSVVFFCVLSVFIVFQTARPTHLVCEIYSVRSL